MRRSESISWWRTSTSTATARSVSASRLTTSWATSPAWMSKVMGTVKYATRITARMHAIRSQRLHPVMAGSPPLFHPQRGIGRGATTPTLSVILPDRSATAREVGGFGRRRNACATEHDVPAPQAAGAGPGRPDPHPGTADPGLRPDRVHRPLHADRRAGSARAGADAGRAGLV